MTLKKIIDHFGSKHQILKAIEELAELQRELSKYLCSFDDDLVHNLQLSRAVAEEMADVELMLDQLKLIFKLDNIEKLKEYKTKRTLARYDLI